QTAIADGTGHATFTVSLVEGANNFSATATDAAGNPSSAGSLSVTLDDDRTSTRLNSSDAENDCGVIGDNKTNLSTVHINVAAHPGSRSFPTRRSSDLQTAIADGTGHATFTVSLVEGANNFSATATDAAGNPSSAGSLSVTLD